MSIYRCASCGSANVITDEIDSGVRYNLVKGIVATEFLGVAGAMSGIESKQKTIYYCRDCNAKLSYTMSPEIKNLIDLGELTPGMRNNLNLYGVHMDWETLKRIYKNIPNNENDTKESGLQKYQDNVVSFGTATKKEFDEALGTITKFRRINGYYEQKDSAFDFPSEDNPFSLEEYLTIQSALDTIAENYPRFLPFHEEKYLEYYISSFALSFLRSYALSHYSATRGKPLNLNLYRADISFGGSRMYIPSGGLADYLNSYHYMRDCVIKYESNNNNKLSEQKNEDLWLGLHGWWNNKDNPFMYKSVEIVMERDTLLYSPEGYPSKYNDSGKNNIRVFIPDYEIINGLLCTSKWTYDHKWWKLKFRELDAEHFRMKNTFGFAVEQLDDNYFLQMFLKDYFTVHPDRIEQYNKRINEFFDDYDKKKNVNIDAKRNLEDRKTAIESQLSKTEGLLSNANAVIRRTDEEIKKMQSKIFGKAKAQQRISELLEEEKQYSDQVKNYLEETRKLKNEITELKKKISDLPSQIRFEDKFRDRFYDFIMELMGEYNYFGVWTPVDETKCKNKLIGEKQKAEVTKEEPVSANTPVLSQADEILKFKNLLDAGIITAEEFEKKKQQLLGL